MWLWRISNHATLDGIGGTIANGRWHSRGRPVVYLAESSALALLEVLVRAERTSLPERYQLLQIECPDGCAHVEWGDDALPDEPGSQAWGDAWLESRETHLARVPAAVAPYSYNWLLNPHHPDAAKLSITKSKRWPWDKRLFWQSA